jgi:MoaA/NifB/PqqE/SkfB family radical SAM enzyme
MHPILGKMMILAQWLLTRRPTSVAVDITHKCNLKCLHCYWWKQEHPPELSDEQMIAFLKKLRESGLRAAILYGGEPTLRPRNLPGRSTDF